MNFLRNPLIVAAGASLALAGCSQKAAAPAEKADKSANAAEPAKSNDPIQSAMAAAPEAIARDAAIIVANPDGSMKTLREGKNGFTCMPDNPTSPGPDPMCMDGNGMKFMTALIAHRPPPADAVGLMYMLAGGTDASNTDPYAKKPTAEDPWIKTGPHVMVVGSPSILAGYPSGKTPDTKSPYVMWAGTPYAHLMVPVR
jgi:hypothetical protein